MPKRSERMEQFVSELELLLDRYDATIGYFFVDDTDDEGPMAMFARIDAPDGAFDYVACVDGLEHMTDPYTAVAEFARVLKPGGTGVFSIPNYTNIERRICFLFRGVFTKPVSNEAYENCGRNLFNFHNSPITITILEFMLRINGLQIVEFKQNALKLKQMLWWPLVAMMRLINCVRSDRIRKELRTDLTLDSKVILGGNNLIVIVRKCDG